MKKDIAFGGVTRVPGGAVSSDGDLCAAVDVCNDGMGLEMLEKPTLLFELSQGEELLCIHEPEGEGRHYITQLVVESTVSVLSAPMLRSGDDPEDTPADDEEVEPTTPKILDYTPYAGTYTPTSSGSSASIEPYSPPVEAETDVSSSDFEAEMGDMWQGDNGGTNFVPSAVGDLPSAGIYLCYWVIENNQYARKQMIDITPYGKVNAIQPMGNTLVCNHEGNTTTIDGDTVTYPAEIRYWLWKAEDSEYIGLGAKPPFVNISFGLNSTFEYYPKKASTFTGGGVLKRYGGVFVTSYPYTDTVPLYWNKVEGQSYVPPLRLYKEGTFTPDGGSTSDPDVFAHWQSSYSIDGVESPDGKTDVAGIKTNWTTMVLGCYNKFIAEQHKKNKFVFPFYVRYAIELYDGSLIMHSNPVLMIPNSRGPIFALDGKNGLKADLDDEGHSYEKVRIEFRGRTYGFSSTLMRLVAKLSEEEQERLENWKDLIRGVNIYVTPPIYNYKQGGQVLGWKCMSEEDLEGSSFVPWYNGEWSRFYTVGKTKYTDITSAPNVNREFNGTYSMFWAFDQIVPKTMGSDHAKDIFNPWSNNAADTVPDYILDIPQKDDDEIKNLHENAGQFYKLGSIEFESLIDLTKAVAPAEEAIDIGNNKVNTIANQDIMQDDNGSHDTISADVLYGYNRRLNMANVSKILHSPLLPSTSFAKDYDEAHDYQIIINAKNGSQIARLKSTETSVYCGFPQYIFYPNPNAFEALIFRQFAGNAVLKYRVPLKEHKALNGAFWLADFTNQIGDIENYGLGGYATAEELALPEANKVVDESNKIYTSETDNPFYVPFGNINIAGGGEVRALASAVEAMSQGQFGQHPMYCFTSEGVWAMTVSDTGGWATIQPVTRDVISAGTMPLSLDSTVVFLTERGLLQLAGSQVKVLSDVLQGADPLLLDTPNFGLHRLDDLCGVSATNTGSLLNVATSLATTKFPEQAWMAYDYDNARIYVTPQNGGGSWVYNLKSQIWTQSSTTLDRQIVSYPECEQQCGGNVVRISVDRAILSNLCDKGLVISRPIKLSDMGLLKRWREIAVRGRFKPYSTAVQVALWGTRDWIDYALVASSTRNRLTRWSGSPYFGHSVGLFLTRPNYAMQVAGMDIDVDAEHDNKLR